MIKIKDLPLEYVNRYGHINVVTPSGKKVSLKEAYKKYGETHIKENDVPYLTDFLTNQQQLDNATKREVEVALADKNIHNNFNMTSPDEQGTSNAKKVIGPILKGAAVATGLSYLLPQIPTFLTSNLGKQLVEPILKGEIANETVKLLGYKNGWGEGMYHVFGGKDYDSLPWYSKLGLDFTNLGYYGPTTKILTPIDELGKQYINYTTNDVALTEKELAKKIDNIIKDTKLEPTQQTVNEIVLLPKTKTTTYIKPWKESWEPTTRLYRVTGTSGKFEPSRDGTKEYVGMWFTDSPTKPNKYALETWKRSNRTGEPNPLELQYIDIPNSQLEHFRASKIADLKQVEFEPEDFIIPLDYPRLKIPYPILLQKGMNQFKLLLTDLSKYTPHKPIKYNTATSVELEGRPQLYFEAVTDQEPGNISIHFKTDGRKGQSLLTGDEKKVLFEELDKLIPEGYKVSTYGSVSKGGIHGLNKLAQENGYTQVGTRIVLDKIGNTLEIPIFLKPLNSYLLNINVINNELKLYEISRLRGKSPIPTNRANADYYAPLRLMIYDDTTGEMISRGYKTIDEVPNLRETIENIKRRIKAEDILPEFLNDATYVNSFRENASRQGIDVSSLSNEDIAKILTELYQLLSETSLGLLKDQILWRTWGRHVPQETFNWLKNIGSFTGNEGFWGNGNYFSTGRYGTDYQNQPYMIKGINEIGYDDLLGATEKAEEFIRNGLKAGSSLATKWMELSPSSRMVAATENGYRNKYGFLDTDKPGIEVVTLKNTGIKALNPDLTVGNGYTFPRDWLNPNTFKSILPFVLGGSTLYNTNQKN